jgi:hypothetical protein
LYLKFEDYVRKRGFTALTSVCEKTSVLLCSNILKTGIKEDFYFLSMQHIIGISRQQVRFSSLEDTISPDNQVRFIDAFVESIDL